jgi:hypothetical protein
MLANTPMSDLIFAVVGAIMLAIAAGIVIFG